MPARRTRRRAANSPNRVQIEYISVDSITPYEWNPRDNQEAVDSVAASISNFGFLVPVVIDAEGTLVTGHTRLEAAKKLEYEEIPAIRATHLTEDQLNAFRIIDNKVSELASWDFDLLSGEILKLQDSGLTLTDFGWTQNELDCLGSMVAEDCLSAEGLLDPEDRDRLRRAERRAPSTSRIVIGEIVFFVPATAYRSWVDGIRVLCDYQEEAIIEEIKRRLGMPQ